MTCSGNRAWARRRCGACGDRPGTESARPGQDDPSLFATTNLAQCQPLQRAVPVQAWSADLRAVPLLYDFARLETDAAEQHAVANSLRSPLTPEQLCQRRGATFARLRMEAQLYCLRAAATRFTGAAPYASSLLARSRARARCGAGAFAPAPAAHVRASR